MLRVEQKSDSLAKSRIMATQTPRSPMDHEGLIPVRPEVLFVVDCPSLHIVNGDDIERRWQTEYDRGLSMCDQSFCSSCRQVITKSRQITTERGEPITGYEMLGEVSTPSPRYSNPLPELVVPPNKTFFSGSLSPKTLKPKKTSIFSRFASNTPVVESQKNRRSSRSITSSENTGTLPRSLSFCFSLTGTSLIIWKKDGLSLTRVELESYGSRLLDLTEMLPVSNEASTVILRFVAEGDEWIAALMSHNRKLLLLLLHSSGLREKSTLHYIDEILEPRGLVISADNTLIAVGFGTRIHLFSYQDGYQQWRTSFLVPSFNTTSEVKFQEMSFSSDSTTLVVATQRHDVVRSVEDDTISTFVFKCIREPQVPLKMGACKMPTDGQGLISIYHSPTLSISLILGASPTPYSPFLAPFPSTSYSSYVSSSPLPIPVTLTEFRIRCACLSLPPNSHVAYMLDYKNKVFRIDIRTRSFVQIADLNVARGNLRVNEEAACIGVSRDGNVRVFWRQGSGLWVYELGDGVGGALDGRGKKVNLRNAWEDAGDGR